MNSKRIATVLRLAALSSLFAVCSAAQAHGGSGNLSLHVDPMIVEFSSPGDGERTASITVANTGALPERIAAQGVDWHTSVDGAVTIERVGTERDRSLTPYLSVSPAAFVLAPGESREVALTLHAPVGAQGARWGGFLIRATGINDSAAAMAPGATVFVYETDGVPRRHLALTGLALRSSEGGRPAEFTARFLNDGETYVRPLCRLVVERGDTVVRDVAIPANVIFPGDKRTLREPLETLPRGNYHLRLTVDYGGGTILDGAIDVRVP